MTVDEYGREPGVDYSDQSWTIHGFNPVKTLEEAEAIQEQIDAGEIPAT